MENSSIIFLPCISTLCTAGSILYQLYIWTNNFAVSAVYISNLSKSISKPHERTCNIVPNFLIKSTLMSSISDTVSASSKNFLTDFPFFLFFQNFIISRSVTFLKVIIISNMENTLHESYPAMECG